MREIGQRLREIGHLSQEKVIMILNPVIQGWANYYRAVVAYEVFHPCDAILYTQLAGWARKKHPARGKRWINGKYWRKIGNNRWVFATPEGKKIRTHDQTKIQRHIKVKGMASPYDGNLIYWYKRLRDHPLMESEKAKLLRIQKGMCPRCGLYFRDGDLLEVDHSIPTALGGKDDRTNKWVYHKHCHDEKTAEDLVLIAKRKAAGITHN